MDSQVMPVFIDLYAETADVLRTKLVDAICKYRLYTDMQLQALFQQAEEQNQEENSLGTAAAQEVCRLVEQELDSQLPN